MGLGWHPDPHKHFDDGGVAEAERRCAEVNRDVAAFLPSRSASAGQPVSRANARAAVGGIEFESCYFDSPLPDGCAVNDRVEVCLCRPAGLPR